MEFAELNANRKVLQGQFRFLKENLHPEIASEYLYSCDILSKEDMDLIKASTGSMMKIEILVKTVLRKNDRSCMTFASWLRNQPIIGEVIRRENNYAAFNGPLIGNSCLTEQQKILLQQEIEPCIITDILLQYEALTLDEHDELSVEMPRYKKVSLLIRKISEKGEKCFETFMEILHQVKATRVLHILKQESGQEMYTGSDPNTSCVQMNYRYLVRSTSMELLPDKYSAKDVISKEECEQIQNIKIEHLKSDRLIKVALTGGSRSYECFMAYLDGDNKHNKKHIEDVWTERQSNGRRQNLSQVNLDQLINNRSLLEDEIDPKEIPNLLFEEKTFDVMDHDDILGKMLPREKCLLTINKVFSKADFTDDLIYALEETKSEYILSQLNQQRNINEFHQEENTNQTEGQTGGAQYDVVLQCEGPYGGDIEENVLKSDDVTTVMRDVNFVNDTSMTVLGIDKGSVIFHLRPLTDEAWKNVEPENCELFIKSVKEMICYSGQLKDILAHHTGKLYEILTQLQFVVKVYKLPQEGNTDLDCQSNIPKQKLIDKWDLLLDELEPSGIVDQYVAEGLLTQDDRQKLLVDPGRKKRVHNVLCDIIRSDRHQYVERFFIILEKTGNCYVLNKLGTFSQQEFHENAERERRCIIANYKIVVDELDNGTIRDTLNRCQNVSEDLKKTILPTGGNSRRKRAHEFLKFILNEDINVLSFLIVAKENGLNEIIHFQKTPESSSPFIMKCEQSRVSDLQRAEGVMLDCSFTIGLDGIDPQNEEKTSLFNVNSSVVADILIQRGAKVNQKDNMDKTPLFHARSAEIAECLIKHGASVNERDDGRNTPLFYVQSAEIAECLIKHGASVNERDVDGKTPLFYVQSAEIAECLIKHGASANERDYKRKTPLFYVQSAEIAECLIKHGASVNERDYDISDKLENMDGKLGNIEKKLESKEEIIDRDPRIKRLIENTKLILETHKKSLYVANSSAETVAYKRLIKHHRVTLSGRGGSGKTSLAKQLMVKFCEEKQQYTAAVVQKTEDFDAIVGKDNLIIFIDDPFGSSNTNRVALEEWEKKFDNMLSFCQNGNVHIIIGCRSSIMTECNDTLRKHGLILEKKTVDLSSQFVLTTKEKLELLEAYCKQHNIDISDTENEELMSNSPTSTYQMPSHSDKKKPRKSINRSILNQIAKTDPFWGFPQCCNLFFSFESLYCQGVDFFTHVDENLKHAISFLRRQEPIQYFSLVLMLLEGGEIDLNKMNDEKIKQLGECLGQKYTKCDIVDCISHEISKVYIENVEISTQWSTQSSRVNLYRFTHVTILESVLLSFCNRFPKEFLNLGCDSVIKQFARSCKYQQKPGEICFKFPVDCQKQLARWLISNDKHFYLNNSTSDESFVEVLLNELEVHDVPFNPLMSLHYTDPNATRKDEVFADLLYWAVFYDRYCLVIAMCRRYINYKQVYSEESMTVQPYQSKPKLYVKSFLLALNYILEEGEVAIAEELIQSSGLDISYVPKSWKDYTGDAQYSIIMYGDHCDIMDNDHRILISPDCSTAKEKLKSKPVFPVCYAAKEKLKSLVMFCLDRLEDGQLKYVVENLVLSCCVHDWVDVIIRIKDKIVFRAKTNTPSTPILLTAQFGRKNLVLNLLKYNVDFTVIDESGNSLCHYCAVHGWTKEVALCVKSNPELVNAQNKDAMTPILLAAKHGKKETVLELLQHGADTSLQDNNGNTVYHYYAANDWDDMIKNCVDTTLVLSCKNKKGFLPLHIAMVFCRQKVVELLLDSHDYSHHELFTPFQMICVGHFDDLQYDISGFNARCIQSHIHNCIGVFEYILRHNHDTVDSFCKPLDENGYTIIQLFVTISVMCDCVMDWLALNYKKALFVRNKTELPTTLHMAAYLGSHRLFTNMYQRGVRCSDGDLSITDTVKLGKQNAGNAWSSDEGWAYGTSECLFRKTVFPYRVHFRGRDDYISILEFCVQNSIH